MTGETAADPSDPSTRLERLADHGLDLILGVFETQDELASLPLLDDQPADQSFGTEPTAGAASPSATAGVGRVHAFTGPDVRIFDLDKEDDLDKEEQWKDLSRRFLGSREDNTKPWFRCIGILRGMGARAALAERYYVCLDHKSEHAAFYSHIDEPRTATAIRIHFFDRSITEQSLSCLTDLNTNYLGYIVCRRGNLPLVARAMIRTPSYVLEAAEVTEPVHLLGQTITVKGCPFMQQDERFANCAHVAIWSICYTAYRRGMMERRVIADIVNADSAARTLRPADARGLYPEQVDDALTEFGFRPISLTKPYPEALFELPSMLLSELPDDVVARLEKLLGPEDVNACADAITQLIADRFNAMIEPLNEAGTGTADRDGAELAALELLRDYLLAPYIRSRLPIYLATRNHAMVLVGRADRGDGLTRYFVHDDQLGPYLVADGLAALSIKDLTYQTGFVVDHGQEEPNDCPVEDRVLAADFEQKIGTGLDTERRVQSIIIPAPARALLRPWEAAKHSLNTMKLLRESIDDYFRDDPPGKLTVETTSVRQSLLMGIDYKSERLRTINSSDTKGAELIRALSLAEWVVVVEGINAADEVVWECVYDASSSDGDPRIQYSRFLGEAVLKQPRAQGQTQHARVTSEGPQPIVVPERLGKVQDGGSKWQT